MGIVVVVLFLCYSKMNVLIRAEIKGRKFFECSVYLNLMVYKNTFINVNIDAIPEFWPLVVPYTV